MQIIIDGEELEAKNLFTAPTRAVQALQRQTGLKMGELLTKATDEDDIDTELWSLKVLEFLTEHARGRCVKWEKLWDRPLPGIVPDAYELRQAEEAGEAADPTQAQTDSPAAAAPVAHVTAAKTHKSHGSSKKNRGSKTKSGHGRSTS